jgi:hypothetical protein
VSGKTYSIQDGAADAYLHVLPEDLPAVLKTATDAVFDVISFHVFGSIAYPMSGTVYFQSNALNLQQTRPDRVPMKTNQVTGGTNRIQPTSSM